MAGGPPAHLKNVKALTRLRDLVAAERRALPWMRVDKPYVFARDERGQVFHTYSSYARGNEEVVGACIYLDLTPKGRNETQIMDWVRRHDEYARPVAAASCCGATSRDTAA